MKLNYSFIDLLDLGRVTYINQVEDETWEKLKETRHSKVSGQPQFLALVTEILNKLKGRDDSSVQTDASKCNGSEKRTYQVWKYENPEGNATKEVRGAMMKWCTKNCHYKSMWCGRKNYLGKRE